MKKVFLALVVTIFFGSFYKAAAQVTAPGSIGTDSASRAKAKLEEIRNLTEALKHNGVTMTNKASLYAYLGSAELDLKQYAKALDYYTKALAVNPGLWTAHYGKAEIYQTQGEPERAVSEYKLALSHLKPDDGQRAVVYSALALVYKFNKQLDKAIEADSLAISINPGYAPAYSTRAQLYAIQGKYQLAINDLTLVLSGPENRPRALSVLLTERGDLKRMLKQFKEAINDYSLAIKMNPEAGNAYWNRAVCYSTNGDYQLASDDYNRAIPFFKRRPKSLKKIYDDLALMKTGLQQYKEAVAYDSLALAIDTAYDEAWYHKANARAQNGDYKQSNADFARALQYYKANPLATVTIYTSMAHNEYFLNNYQGVIDYCSKAIALNTINWSPYFERGRAYLKVDKKDLATNDFKQILLLDTSKQTADYAFSLFYTGSPDKAVEVMQAGFLKTNDTFDLIGDYYNMACLFSLMNKKDDALNYLKKCIDGGYNKKYALTDADFDNIRETAEFKNIIQSK